jgi:hypothetical protein
LPVIGGCAIVERRGRTGSGPQRILPARRPVLAC